VAQAKKTGRRPPRPPAKPKRGRPGAHAADVEATRRARFLLLGSVIASAVVIFAWFPVSSLLSQRSNLATAQSQLSALRSQDAALAQEKKNLNNPAEIGRIARQQYQLVSPGQQPYQVLPPTGSTAAKAPYAGDPGSSGPVVPSASSELPPGATTPPASTKDSKHVGGGSDPGFLARMAQTLEFWR
jgi:cell division protein FtsB